MVTIRDEISFDSRAREQLLDQALGPQRFTKASEQVRVDRLPAQGLAFSAVTSSGQLVGTVRLWHIVAGSAGASLLLGPLAVAADFRRYGLGRQLMQQALISAQQQNYASILLVGDYAYYQQFGFNHTLAGQLYLPLAPDPERLLAVELRQGSLHKAMGAILASGPFIATGHALAA